MTETALDAACWNCGGAIAPEDRYCRRCGRGQGEQVAWYYRHWGIAVATLLGLGPFGLILVWRSPLLSSRARWIWTALVLLATGYTLLAFYRVWVMAMQLLPDMARLAQPY
jgi:hypothetical protein